VVQQTKSQLAAHWADFAEYFRIVAQQYDQAYQALKDQPQQV
jgi:hypothetical protein